MKKLTVVLFALVAWLAPVPGIQSLAAAQTPAGMIAYDYCQLYDWDQGVVCSVYLVSADGSRGAHVGDGTDPAWSPDGSRLAFGGYSQTGIFVLNLADWSVANLPVNGRSPAWSPDGLKLAFAADELYVMGVDGSDAVQITRSVGFVGHPAWSSNGSAIAFDCEIDPGNRDICTIQADGTGFVRLTSDPAWDSGAAFSPDGSKIAFATAPPSASPLIAVMNTDGTGMTQLAPVALEPAWSPDGARIAFVSPYEGACQADGTICSNSIGIMNADGTSVTSVTSGDSPAWTSSTRPVAAFQWLGCSGLVCDFDGTASWGGDGGIVSYEWDFGDGTTGSGATVSHAYSAAGTYSITLTVTDTAGVQAVRSGAVEVVVNQLPSASFTFGCTHLTCVFNAYSSSDPDGYVASYAWTFGDGATGSGEAPSRTYATGGTYSVTLTVTDNRGAASSVAKNVTVITPEMHVGDLDRASTAQGSTWTATVTSTVHDSAHLPVANAQVSGFWSDGRTGSCATTTAGRCAVSRPGIPNKTNSVKFTVTNLALEPFVYKPASNHDPDGDSSGTEVTVTRR